MYDRIMLEMKRIMNIAMKATLGQLTRKHKHQCFEIYGFDFLLDRELNVRLIEANCNPAITEDCPLLAELIPKMLSNSSPMQMTPSSSPLTGSIIPKTQRATTSPGSLPKTHGKN
jgi:hypothetical protein